MSRKSRKPPARRRVTLLIESSNKYGRELLRGVHHWTRENASWALQFVERGREEGVPAWLRTWEGEGIIARVETPGIGAELKALGLPVVDVSAALEEPIFPRVVTDSARATQMALDHFLSCGLRNIAYCGDDRFHWSRKREASFREQAEAAGAWVGAFHTRRRRPEAVRRAIVRWLTDLPKPVGVLACYDMRGQEVLEACRDAGLRVPDDVAVMGIHNDELLCELCDPPLTSIEPNARRAGFEAAALLGRLFRGETPPRREFQIEPVGVVTRQSTDLIAVNDTEVAAAVRFIRDKACDGINVGDVLRAVPMARTRLEQRFRQLLGRTPREEIERVRLARVKELLAHTTLSVALIAERTGFAHPEYLTVAFRRASGMTPRAFRSRV